MQDIDPTKAQGPSATDPDYQAHLLAMAECLRDAQHTIAAIRAEEIPQQHIPSASGELSAIKSQLEEAAGQILDACASVEAAVEGSTPGTADLVQEAMTKIYEACVFEDIGGQRITKILKTLSTIEERILALLAAIGPTLAQMERGNGAVIRIKEQIHKEDEISLKNGPQLPQYAPKQGDIDSMFASLAPAKA